MATKVVGSMSDWSGTLKDLFRQIEDGSIKLAELQAFLERRNPFGLAQPEPPAVASSPPAIKRTFAEAMKEAYRMQDMEADHAAFVAEFGDAQTPGKWTLIMLPGLKVSKIIAALRLAGSRADTWYTNPDTAVSDNARNCNEQGSYFLDLEPGADPDLKNAGKSQNDLKKSKEDKVSVNHITWLERWFLELVHFLMSGVNLDKNGIWTICAGSLDSYGFVPCAYFDRVDRGVYGYRCYPGDSDAVVCARSAVPRKPQRVSANS